MIRLFSEHSIRPCTLLDGFWKMMPDPDKIGEDLSYSLGLPTDRSVYVPSVWNTELGMMEYEGVVWYEKIFDFDGGVARIYFGGVMTEATVYLDGEKIGYHYGGFNPFSILTKPLGRGEHSLVVRVENTFDEHSIPQAVVDWHHDGGITRSVSVEALSGISVLKMHVESDLSDSFDSASVSLRLTLKNVSAETLTDTLSAEIDGENVLSFPITLGAYEEKEILTDPVTIESPLLWSPESPDLYSVRVATSTDDLADRFGLRKIEVRDAKIYLNGKEIYFHGVCRHECHPDFGMAFPESLMKKDIALLHDLGANAVRGSHYPNHPVFVDMLDEEGIVFWSEIPIWGVGFSAETLGDPTVVERGLSMIREMVDTYYNHPAILLWGLHNEIKNETPEAYEMTKLYYTEIKKISGNRLVTFASCYPLKDICFDFCDVISINNYTGWYYRKPEEWQFTLDEITEHFAKIGQSEKPILFSEFGAAALYGERTFEKLPWSEDFQADLLCRAMKVFAQSKNVKGEFIWQFTDGRTALEWHTGRPRCFNNKGILTEYRQPKLAYYAVKDLWKKEKQ